MPNVKFYLERHGATDFNAIAGSPDLIRGWIDLPLNRVGKDEAAKVADHLADKGIKIIYCSDLLRARQTAEALAETTKAKVIPIKGLRPWDLGSFTGRSYQEIKDQVTSYAKNKPDKDTPGGGESFNTFLHRLFPSIYDCLKDAKDGEVVLVSHHRCERAIKAWIDAGEPPKLDLDWATFLKKGEPTGKFELLSINLDNLAKAAKTKAEKWDDGKTRGEVAL